LTVVPDALRQANARRQRQRKKQIPFGNDKQKARQRQRPMRGFFAALRMTSSGWMNDKFRVDD